MAGYPNPYPSPQPALFDDFDNGIDPQRWLIADKAWGGDNGGVVPPTSRSPTGSCTSAHMATTTSRDVLGHGERTTRVGAVIVTRDYYASGRYEVHAKVPEVLGAASAFWSFHYIEYSPPSRNTGPRRTASGTPDRLGISHRPRRRVAE